MVADLAWDIHLSDSQVWQREAIIIEAHVQAPSQYARLKTDEKLKLTGSSVVALPLKREKNNSTGSYQLNLSWRITPHEAGQKTIQLPTLHYSLNGANHIKWQAPAQVVNVKALPPYFPPTLPIGKVNITSKIEPEGILTPNTLAYWRITLQSKQVTPEQFPPLLKQIKASPDFEIFPAKLSATSSFETSNFKQEYLIPIKPKSNGLLNLPPIKWYWFNPNTGRLEKQNYQAPRSFVLSTVWQAILASLLLIFSFSMLYKLSHVTYRAYLRWRAKEKFKKAIIHPKKIEEIKTAMRQCALTHHWESVYSNKQWLANWTNTYGEDKPLHKAIEKFEKKHFGKPQ